MITLVEEEGGRADKDGGSSAQDDGDGFVASLVCGE